MKAFEEAQAELDRAKYWFPPMVSAHEGYAILLEEIDELWAEIKVHQSRRSIVKMRKEAIQVAAMALRFVEDVCNVPDPTSTAS